MILIVMVSIRAAEDVRSPRSIRATTEVAPDRVRSDRQAVIRAECSPCWRAT